MLKHPTSKLNKNWNKIEWRIKWSEYGLDGEETTTDPGVMASLGWIRFFINDEMLIDEKLPMGNNAQGRIPYFKFGLIAFCKGSSKHFFILLTFVSNKL